MTDPERAHTGEPAEGSEQPAQSEDSGRTPHPDMPAEGSDSPGGADTPSG